MRPPLIPLRRVVIVVPSLFTLFNLFFGIWSMVLASRGEFYRASWYIVFAGILDTLDGRIARLARVDPTHSASRSGRLSRGYEPASGRCRVSNLRGFLNANATYGGADLRVNRDVVGGAEIVQCALD